MNRGTILVIGVFFSAAVFATDYDDALAFARQKSGEGASLFQKFNAAELPEFTQSPREADLKPSAKGELEAAGQRYIEQHSEALEIYRKADENKETPLDEASQQEAKDDLEKAQNQDEQAPCSDGACIPVKEEESQDFSEGAVELGALGSVAQDVRDGQLQSGVPGIFKAKNTTCRTVFRANRVNFCLKDQDILSASKEEKALHQAQREGRAQVVSGGNTYCSKRKKIFGKRRCVEKRQSWCVFQSKLARIVQVEARRQLGLSFGAVWGNVNKADCRGLTPSEISRIQFDTPQMQAALQGIVSDYRARVKPLQGETARAKTDEYLKHHAGGIND